MYNPAHTPTDEDPMKKSLLALPLLALLAVTGCGGSNETAAETSSPTASASSSPTESSSPTSTTTFEPAGNVGTAPEGSDLTVRVTANGAYRVAYDDAEGNTVYEKFTEGTPFEVSIPGLDGLWSIMADNPAKEGATEIKCEILVDGEVVAHQTQAENENQSYPTTYCAISPEL